MVQFKLNTQFAKWDLSYMTIGQGNKHTPDHLFWTPHFKNTQLYNKLYEPHCGATNFTPWLKLYNLHIC